MQASLLFSVSLFLITLTFDNYFYYLPFRFGFNLLSFLQFLTICGWILLIAAPPLFLASEFKWTRLKFWLFLSSVSLWTISTLFIKIYTLFSIGQIPYQYLVAFPIMIYFEWIIPILYVYIGWRFYKPVSPLKKTRISNRVRFDDEDQEELNVRNQGRERFDD